MITKSDWKAVHEQLLAEDRRRLGAPPSTDELLAYSHGELSPEQEERIRELLACDPELARAMAEPFPAEAAQPGDHDYVTDEEFAEHWAALKPRLKPPGTFPTPFPLHVWHAAAAIAAGIAVVLAVLLLQSRSNVSQLTEEAQRPHLAVEEQVLQPDGQRGGSDNDIVLTAQGDSYLLVAPLINTPAFNDCRFELVSLADATPKTVWKSETVARGNLESFAIMVPRTFLKPGRYQLLLYGRSGGREEQLSTYTLRVPRQRPAER